MSRNNPAYMSTSNMSGIKQSIQQYSMDFQQSQQAISQMISVSKTGKNISMSKFPKSQNPRKSASQISEKNQQIPFQQEIIQSERKNQKSIQRIRNNDKDIEPVNLGLDIFKIIKERYKELQGTQTSDAYVLLDFFKRQKKNFKGPTDLDKKSLEGLLPSSQRKMLVKIQFQRILTYYTRDIELTLIKGQQKFQKSIKQNEVSNRIEQKLMNKPKQKKDISEVVNRLYGQHSVAIKQKSIQQQRLQFVELLKQAYWSQYQSTTSLPIISAQGLYQFWEKTDKRKYPQLEWKKSAVLSDIKLVMNDEILKFKHFLEKKLGLKQFANLEKLYLKYHPVYGVFIPKNSFQQYLNVYNQLFKQIPVKSQQQIKSQQKLQEKKAKEKQIKRFGRPMSATPISVLSKPKTTTNYLNLAEKYGKDKFLSTLLHTDKMKFARHGFEYGIHNLEQEVKVKGRVKIKINENYEQKIFQMLNSTFTNKSFFNANDQNQVLDILSQQDIAVLQNWKQLGPILREAMLVQAFEHHQFRDILLNNFLQSKKQDYKCQDNKFIVSKFIQYLNDLTEDSRSNKLSFLYNKIEENQRKAQRIQMKHSENPKHRLHKQKYEFYRFLQSKAVDFIDMRLKRKQVNLRKFLNEIFAQSLKQHKSYLTTSFPIVTGDKQCPPLLKYQFYKLQKQINPFTKQRDLKVKCHAWIPTKSTPQNFNYHTYNSYAQAYQIDKNKILSEPQKDKYKNSIWSHDTKMAKEREVLMMSYDDAKECVFHPKISKMV